MEQNNSFQKVLGRVERMAGKLWDQIRLVKDCCQAHQLQMAYEQALRLEETAERLVLLTRALPAYTGSGMAKGDVENIMKLCIPVDYPGLQYLKIKQAGLYKAPDGRKDDRCFDHGLPAADESCRGFPDWLWWEEVKEVSQSERREEKKTIQKKKSLYRSAQPPADF